MLLKTDEELRGLVTRVQADLHLLFRLSESVALCDMLSAFALFVQRSGEVHCRPMIDPTFPHLTPHSHI